VRDVQCGLPSRTCTIGKGEGGGRSSLYPPPGPGGVCWAALEGQ
jgi:hypothetical protein